MQRHHARRNATLLTLSLLAVSGGLWAEPYHGDGHLLGTPDDLSWGPVGSMGEGAEIAIIEGDLSAEAPFTLRLRLADGYEIKPHVHPAYERVTVLEGTLHFAHGESFERKATQPLPVGGYAIMSPGDPMFGYADGETIIQLHGTGPWGIEYLDPADDPRQ
ncbi:cupin [Billgrantia pellis]|uniref:Cupin n=1 Tax=Billgrantia pellis TaxID=2606936 RepID=A0A7V7KIA7_9GAMM|nr:cupin domain-containing protein [Halomonas pellis]KAA0012758.1 cupin [Halomonas pellis]